MATTASIPVYLLPGVPVVQPPHLEGDASLATEILPGPPSAATVQQMALKRDPKKPSMAYSYLPPSDPGSTYSGIMHGTLIGQDPDGARSKRDKGAATGRAQRASARQQGTSAAAAPEPGTSLAPSAASAPQPMLVDTDPIAMAVEDELMLSRSNSDNPQSQDAPPTTAGIKGKRKDKGKGKEVYAVPLRVKEEPKALLLNTPEPASNLLNNQDHCSSCRFSGSLVYCDGCPKAFHLWCLDPPLEGVDDARWFCPTCVARKHPPRKPPPSLLSPVIHHLQTSYPVEFQLPEEIRSFFKDVGTGPRGAYVDTSEIKPPRLNRLGQLEDRDPHRLRDRNGGPVICYQCGQSALPNDLSASAPASKRPRRSTSKAASPDSWKSMVSCDHCSLHWHLDCLDPPLSTLPPFNKKWMCPNHAEKVLPPKRRIPKHHAPPVEITRPRQFNNGNIDVIHPQYTTAVAPPTVPVDEVLINGRRYRVPEKIIVLDFWNKLNKWDEHLQRDDDDLASGVSSPLTELSSLDDEEDHPFLHQSRMLNGALDDYGAAQVLCGLATRRPEADRAFATHGRPPRLVDRSVQTESDSPISAPPVKNKVGRPRKYPLPADAAANGVSRNTKSTDATYVPSSGMTVSALRRKRAPQPVLSETTTRELRSRSRNLNADTPATSLSSRQSSLQQGDESSKDNSIASGSLSSLPVALNDHFQLKSISVKMEEIEAPLTSPILADNAEASTSGPSKPRVIRSSRQSVSWQKDTTTVAAKETKEKRGRKRKIRDEDLPGNDGENDFVPNGSQAQDSGKHTKAEASDSLARETRKIMRTPSRHGQLSITNPEATPSASAYVQSPSTTTNTPSLKIRLPRLGNFGAGSTTSNANLDSPTRR